MWCWLQPLGQPDILMWSFSRQRVGDVHRLEALLDRLLRPMEAVIPSLQESVPGQETTSVISSWPASPRPSCDQALHTS